MNREWLPHYSGFLDRELHIMVHGHTGVPLIAIPCQDAYCDNWENFQMPDTLADYIESGAIQLFTLDTVDKESWSDTYGDAWHRADVQERYFRYVTEEAVPYIREINGTDSLPIITGFSLGATHALLTFLRRPDLFEGVLALSGAYDAQYFFGSWMNETLYNNSPEHFMRNLPTDHPYIDLYNQKKIIVCVGQGRWEDEGRRSTAAMREIFNEKGINAWVDFWGYDVDHDWPWWRKEIRYFLPYLLGEEE